MSTPWAVLVGILVSLVLHGRIWLAATVARNETRDDWVTWLRDAWAEAIISLDVSANVHKLDTPEALNNGFNAVLESFLDWPGADSSDDITIAVAKFGPRE